MIDSLHALLIDGDVQARARLKETLRNIVYKCEVQVGRSLKEGEAALTNGEHYDVVFVSSLFEQHAILDFLSQGRGSKAGRLSTYVLLLKENARDTGYVAHLYLLGVDGFACEPFVAADLHDMLAMLVHETRRKREDEEKKKAVLEFLIADIADGIDRRVGELYVNPERRGSYLLKSLRETAARMSAIAQESLPLLEEALIEKLGSLPPPNPNLQLRKKKKRKERIKHPGEAIQRMLAERNLPQTMVAGKLELSEGEFGDLLAGTLRVDEHLAKKLSHVLGNTSGFWVHLQNMCDARNAAKQQ